MTYRLPEGMTELTAYLRLRQAVFPEEKMSIERAARVALRDISIAPSSTPASPVRMGLPSLRVNFNKYPLVEILDPLLASKVTSQVFEKVINTPSELEIRRDPGRQTPTPYEQRERILWESLGLRAPPSPTKVNA
jgi:hypothetical protein